jgi:hypothetical protein
MYLIEVVHWLERFCTVHFPTQLPQYTTLNQRRLHLTPPHTS